MLDFFRVSQTTDSGICCRIYVDPARRECAVTVTVDGLIVNTMDQSEPAFRILTDAEWANPAIWNDRAAELVLAHAPRWNPVEAA